MRFERTGCRCVLPPPSRLLLDTSASSTSPRQLCLSTLGLVPNVNAALGACPSFPGYVTRPGEDADGNDFWQQEWDPTAAFAACEINPWCRGFNNKGYMKHKLTDWKADPVLCTYVRSDGAWASQF